jgi:dihydrofolate reductase
MTDAPRIGLIWAEAQDRVIGRDGGMPWRVPEDMARFKAVTMGWPVVMGRRTWESFPERFRPLPGRRNIVTTRQDDWTAEGAERAGSLNAALALAAEADPEWIWVIGGGQLYREAVARADRLDVTQLDLSVDGDTFAPDRPDFVIVSMEPEEGWHMSVTGIRYRFLQYDRVAVG